MEGILRRPMDPEKAMKKYRIKAHPEFPIDAYSIINNLENYLSTIDSNFKSYEKRNFKRYQRAISSEYTLPKKALEAVKHYAISPLARRIESAFV